MENGLYREKSIERISSPEELHDYMRVTSPSIWIVLLAILILLAGFIVFASTTQLENTMDIKVRVESYTAEENTETEHKGDKYTYVSAMIPLSQRELVGVGMEVRILNERGKVSWISIGEGDTDMILLIELDRGYTMLPDGEYDAKLVLETTTPISFLWE